MDTVSSAFNFHVSVSKAAFIPVGVGSHKYNPKSWWSEVQTPGMPWIFSPQAAKGAWLKVLCEASAAGNSAPDGTSPSCFMMLVAAAIMEEASPALAGTMMVFDFLAISSHSKAWKGDW